MEDFIFDHESHIRLGAFLFGLAILSLWELISPERALSTSKLKRWINNIGMVVCSTIIIRLIIPSAAIGVAYLSQQYQWGWMSQSDHPEWFKIIAAIVLLDLIIYLQHLSFHVLPLFWRFHRVHHSDRDCDVSTGLRFHPIEILVSIYVKMLAIFILGAPLLAVILFEAVLNFMSMFTHANIRMPPIVDKVLRMLIVTPDMHRIHHSAKENETNSNFGFFIPWWDRIFGTYLAQPEGGQSGMSLGLDQFNKDRCQTFLGLLLMPIRRTIRGYAINARDASSAAELAQKNTELMIMIRNAEHSRLEAEKANQAKTVFLGNMSHELMTPLTTIIGYSGYLEEEASEYGLTEFSANLERIKQAGGRLQTVMKRLLELSKLEAEKYDEHYEDFSVDELMEEVLVVAAPLFEVHSNELRYEKGEPLGEIRTDRKKLSLIVLNLLENAAKFTDSGLIKLSAGYTEKNGSEVLEISVQDNGVGIEPDKLEHIFNAFYQSDNSSTRKYGGTGLGLTIAQRFCQLLGGDISVSSKMQNGSTFTFWIKSHREQIKRENRLLEESELPQANNILRFPRSM